jgi:two-component system, NarL family, invasion response regulator UvrY
MATEATRPVRVLIVDDNEKYRRVARLVVDSTPGFEVAGVAASGEDAVAVAAELQPDLLLLDVRMDGIGGIEAARRITAAGTAGVVVLISAWADVDLPERVGVCGASATVHKRELGPDKLVALWDQHGHVASAR